MLGIPYPGGPAIQEAAETGDPKRFRFPRTSLHESFSFSGLKTAVRYAVRDLGPDQLDENGIPRDRQTVRDIACSFQQAAVAQLVQGLRAAVTETHGEQVAVVGGVAANRTLRESGP